MKHSPGFTLVELLMVVTLIGILSAIASVSLRRAHITANEASAIATLKAVNASQAAYASACAKGGYAITLSDLARAPAGSQAAFIGPDLATDGVIKSGYLIAVAADAAPATASVGTAASTCNASVNAPMSGYFSSANPVAVGSTGNRFFATDSRGTIFQNTTVAIANPIIGSAATVPSQ